MHTLRVIAGGFILLAVLLLIGRVVPKLRSES
jgi:hypothetical protein